MKNPVSMPIVADEVGEPVAPARVAVTPGAPADVNGAAGGRVLSSEH